METSKRVRTAIKKGAEQKGVRERLDQNLHANPGYGTKMMF